MNKTALITGASRGIGEAIVKKLNSDGFNVAFCYSQSDEKATKLASELGCLAIKADVSNENDVKEMIKTVHEKLGPISVLVNNAGISKTGLLSDLSVDDWNRIFAVNTTGVFLCTKEVFPDMLHNKYGRIVNISSMWGEVGASCEVAYSASKAAVIGFTKAYAKEVGPSGITVNCITPGVIQTDMNKNLNEKDICELIEETPLQRIGLPSDVAEAVSFLVSEKASFITGQVIGVDGGFAIN